MADGTDLFAGILRYAAFAGVAILGPGLAVQRWLRLRSDIVMIAPLGLVLSAAAYGLSLRCGMPALFPAIVILMDLSLLIVRGPWRLSPGPHTAGALAPWAATIVLFAVTQYPLNRIDRTGAFLLDNGEGPDTAFYVGIAWELAAGYPPQTPALAGVPMGYHLGPHLVRGAALRWAGVHPYDAISRFDNTALVLALILILRGAMHALGGTSLAVALVSWAPLAADFSFVYALVPGSRWWSFLCGTNLLHSLFFARSTMFALLMALGIVVAYTRHRDGEGRGWLVAAGLLSLALPFFNVFLGSLMLAGLGWAFVSSGERRALAALLAPMLVVIAALLLGSRASQAEIAIDPLGAVQRARGLLGQAPASGVALIGAAFVWIAASLGVRWLGLPAAIHALRAANPAAAILAVAALMGLPLRLLVHINADGIFDEAAYFAEHGGALLWLFTAPTVAALLTRARPRAKAALAAALILVTTPSTVEFVLRKRSLEPERVSAAAVDAMRALQRDSRIGDVVLSRPTPYRPPLPMVLIGRRAFVNDYIRCLLQFAPETELARRRRLQRIFFRTKDAQEALALARQMNARYLYLPAGEKTRFDFRTALSAVWDREGERVYRFADP